MSSQKDPVADTNIQQPPHANRFSLVVILMYSDDMYVSKGKYIGTSRFPSQTLHLLLNVLDRYSKCFAFNAYLVLAVVSQVLPRLAT